MKNVSPQISKKKQTVKKRNQNDHCWQISSQLMLNLNSKEFVEYSVVRVMSFSPVEDKICI